MARILQNICFHLSLALLLSSLNDTADCITTSPTCNGTDEHCLITVDEAEFPAEMSRRVLASAPMISYNSLNQDRGYCDAQVYGSCIGPDSKYYNERPCNYQNQCNRP